MPESAKMTETSPPYVGTIIGESTSREFRLALAHEAVREQDIIAVDAEMRRTDAPGGSERIRIWAKVQRIERVNPLFPHESGHELAATQTHPLDTVLSLSREMVTAVCQVLGAESHDDEASGRLDHLRYPAQPASNAYRPTANDIARVVIGDLQQQRGRALDLATLSNRPEITVFVDGHDVVTRHLAILAMTGAGKSWTARRTIEELAKKNYPIVIFDPHGDYTGLADVPQLSMRVKRFFATFPVFEEDSETVASIVNTLGYELTPAMHNLFDEVFAFARNFLPDDNEERQQRVQWLVSQLKSPYVTEGNVRKDMYLIGHLAEAAQLAIQHKDQDPSAIQQLQDWGWTKVEKYTKTDAKTLEGMKKRCRVEESMPQEKHCRADRRRVEPEKLGASCLGFGFPVLPP